MPLLPLVPAALLTALRVGKAVAPLIKKYGAKAVKEGKKHLKDLKTKQTPGSKKVEPAVLGQQVTRKVKRRITATAGLAGAAGYVALKASEKKKLKETAKANMQAGYYQALVDKVVSENKSKIKKPLKKPKEIDKIGAVRKPLRKPKGMK